MSALPPGTMAQMPDVRLARRQAILSCAIIRNVVFYYVGWVSEDGQGTLKDDTELGRTINSNFIDMAVLEWAKLFVDARGRHSWQRFVRPIEARTVFRMGLLRVLGLTFRRGSNTTRMSESTVITSLRVWMTMT
ncbi:hypothetical protein PQR68_07395 [Paraburkholderia agricolaris]|uniref:hypothetical protein n=1 Tax=Paraburkholderia agricolaris TaxID=2152888 RepID=UPI0038BADD6A